MIVKRTFVTKLEPVDAFGLSNELLRPRGFVLDKGTPPRSQAWRRGVDPGQKAKGLFDSRQTIEMEMDRGRINVIASATVSGRNGIRAQKMLTSYAEALEHLLASGHTPEVAGLIPKKVEGSLRRAKVTRTLSVCGALVALLVGGVAALKFMPGSGLSSVRRLTGGVAEGKKKSHTPPVIVVRRAGEEASAEGHKTPAN